MPRALRIWIPDGIYHLTVRGNNRQPIFLNAADYQQYLIELRECQRHCVYHVLAFALMPNHVHMVVEASPQASLSDVMHRVSTNYTRYFNDHYHRIGHLYQDRFYSNLVDQDSYLMEVTRYVHLNPFRAGLVRHPAEYLWSSYRMYAELEPDRLGLVERTQVLRFFGDSPREQVQRYRRFVEALAAGELEAWVRKLERHKLVPPRRWLAQPSLQEVPGTFRVKVPGTFL